MPQLTVTVNDRTDALIGAPEILRLVGKLDDANQKALKASAKTATDVTRRSFKYRRDIAPSRPGRSSSGGQMTSFLRWGVGSNSDQVIFDARGADAKVPHWLIQEIGTGETATLMQGPDLPVKVKTVRSQVGRRISAGLVFATGGQYSVPRRGAGHEQLFRAEQISGVPLGAAHGRKGGLRIGKEIEGQHFVQKGGLAGFRQYETSLLAAARQVFGKRTP